MTLIPAGQSRRRILISISQVSKLKLELLRMEELTSESEFKLKTSPGLSAQWPQTPGGRDKAGEGGDLPGEPVSFCFPLIGFLESPLSLSLDP